MIKSERLLTPQKKTKLQERKKFDYLTSEVAKKTVLATHRAGKESLKLFQ